MLRQLDITLSSLTLNFIGDGDITQKCYLLHYEASQKAKVKETQGSLYIYAFHGSKAVLVNSKHLCSILVLVF